jgi:carboxyl-terminal processing protease
MAATVQMTTRAWRPLRHIAIQVLSTTALLSGALFATDVGATGAQLDASLAGTWMQHGYGRVLDISAATVTTYDLTDVSCERVSEETIATAAKKYDRVSRESEAFAYFEVGGITRYEFRRLSQLPKSCQQQAAGAPPVRDPDRNFSVLWHAFQEHYAFFPLRGVNWKDVETRFQPRARAASTDDELFKVFSEMLSTLNDGHVVLRAGQRKFGGGSEGELLELWKSSGGSAAEYEKTVRKHVISDVLKGKAQLGANDTIMWGWAAPGIGYVNTMTMDLPAPAGGKLLLPEQLQLVERTMAQAMKDLAGAKALIVDARFNDGGYDAVALKIMGSFTREPRLAFTKKAVEGQGYTTPQKIYFGPAGATQFTGPIYYLQSGTTMSAAEIFSLAMTVLPNVTRIGTPTYGVFSDELGKRLPNGWSVTLSNEVYLATDGTLYEGRGIPPQVPVAAKNVRDLQQRLRLDIDAVLPLATARQSQQKKEAGGWQ